MCILNIIRAIKNMSINDIRDFIFENYYERIGFSKEESYSMKRLKIKNLLLLAKKLIEKVSDPPNTKEHYISFLTKKNTKNLLHCCYKIRYYRTSKNFTQIIQTIKKGEKIGSNSSLYNYTKKCANILNEKNVKIKKKRTCS